MKSMGILCLIFRSGYENHYFTCTFQLEKWSIYVMENESLSMFSYRPPRHWREHPSIFSPSLHPLHSSSPFTYTLFQHNLQVFSVFTIFLSLLFIVLINRWAYIFIEHAHIKNNIKKPFQSHMQKWERARNKLIHATSADSSWAFAFWYRL